MIRQFLLAWVLLLLLQSGSVFAQATDDSIPQTAAVGNVKDALDGIKQAAESSGIPIPPGGLDGAKSSDLMYQTLKLILGQPLANITMMTTNVDPLATNTAVDNPNVIVYLLSLMAGVGLIGTLVAALWTVLESLVSVSTSAKFMSGSNGGASPFAFMMSRTGISSILNVPIPMAGGMALSQVFMLLMALIGIGLGSALFSAVATRMLNQPLITYNSSKAETFFVQMTQSMLCLDNLRTQGFLTNENSIIAANTREIDGVSNQGRIRFGKTSVCGFITFNFADLTRYSSAENKSKAQSFFSWLVQDGSADIIQDDIDAVYRPAIWSTIVAVLSDAQLQLTIREIAAASPGELGFTPTSNQKAVLASSYAKFKKGLDDGIKSLGNKLNDCPTGSSSGSRTGLMCSNKVVTDSISKYGFMLAGTYSYVLNQRQSQISWAIEDTVPKLVFNADSNLRKLGISQGSHFYNDYYAKASALETTFRELASDSTTSIGQDLNKVYEATTSDGALAEALGDALYSSMRQIVKVGYLGKESSFNNPEPITQLSTIGNTMMAIPFIIVMGDAIISKVNITPLGALKSLKSLSSSFSSSDDDENSFMSQVGAMMLASLMQAVVVGGFFLSVVVPSIPYIIWNMAIFGYLSYVLLVVVGVPIMVASKPLKDGDGFVGGVKTGYQMGFNLLIRPSAMVTGLVLAMTLSRAFSWFINATYFESIQLANSGGYSIAAAFGLPFMYALIQLTTIYKSYAMINEVPAFISKMTETDRAHTDIGDEGERNRIGQAFIQGGQSSMGGMGRLRAA